VYTFSKKQPPCATCFPGVHERNITAFTLWGSLAGQWRFSYGGTESLDIVAIESALRIHDIRKSDRIFVTEQLLTIGDVVLAEWRRKSNRTR
jgi:hypothetical protein